MAIAPPSELNILRPVTYHHMIVRQAARSHPSSAKACNFNRLTMVFYETKYLGIVRGVGGLPLRLTLDGHARLAYQMRYNRYERISRDQDTKRRRMGLSAILTIQVSLIGPTPAMRRAS
jgi:hypothetical protein